MLILRAHLHDLHAGRSKEIDVSSVVMTTAYIQVSSFNVGAQIRQVVEASSNEEWKV